MLLLNPAMRALNLPLSDQEGLTSHDNIKPKYRSSLFSEAKPSKNPNHNRAFLCTTSWYTNTYKKNLAFAPKEETTGKSTNNTWFFRPEEATTTHTTNMVQNKIMIELPSQQAGTSSNCATSPKNRGRSTLRVIRCR